MKQTNKFLASVFLCMGMGLSLSWAHNLDQQMTFITFDEATADTLAARAAAGSNFFQTNDTVGLIFKCTPGLSLIHI